MNGPTTKIIPEKPCSINQTQMVCLILLTSWSSSRVAKSRPSHPDPWLVFFKSEITWYKVTIMTYIKLVRSCQFEDHVYPTRTRNLGSKKQSLTSFWIRIHSMQGWKATTTHRVTRKRSPKRIKHTRNLIKKKLKVKRCLFILDFKPFKFNNHLSHLNPWQNESQFHFT